MRTQWRWVTTLAFVGMTGCSVTPQPSQPSFDQVKDGGPGQTMDVSHIPDPVPRHETRTEAGNRSPYTVLGRRYTVMPDPKGFKQEGVASWYGTKFHGRATSNGEIYDMYGMTAAHKTLPIPSYVRVTNRNNGRSVVVRVNDRGPFHGGRVIDLTYTAAKKLGFERLGTAPVTVEYLDPDDYRAPLAAAGKALGAGGVPAPVPRNVAGYQLPAGTYLQMGAFSASAAAQSMRERVEGLTALPVKVVAPAPGRRFYRVHVGPVSDNLQVAEFREAMAKASLPAPHFVRP